MRMHRTLPALTWLALILMLLALSACGGDPDRKPGQAGANGGETGLPAPDAAGGSVTGMPDRPGPGPVGDNVQAEGLAVPADQVLDGTDNGFDNGNPSPGDVATGVGDAQPILADGPGAQDAVAVLGDYYAALDAHRYGPAYGFWSDGGNASGQTPQQFADGFAETDTVNAQIGQPGRVEAGAGGRWIQVPLSVTAIHRDGSEHRYVGSFTLRRSVVDGASPEQRAWRIASADLRELQP